jgi:carbamoyl-phosphate synthase large subunit
VNILITAIGSFSADAVITALSRYPNVRLIACDINPEHWIPLSSSVNAFYQVPLAYDVSAYITSLCTIIQTEKIEYIIPLTDPEVDVFCDHREVFDTLDVKICMPDNATVKICRDKLAYYQFLKGESNIEVIPTFCITDIKSVLALQLPIVLKPRKGRSSEGLLVIDNKPDLINKLQRLKDYVAQPLYRGDVYTVDYIRQAKSQIVSSISRKELIRTKNGAGLTVEIMYDETLHQIVRHLGEKLFLNGCVNFEFIRHQNTYFLMDINPRFSAGVAFSILAGYDMVTNHLICFTDKKIDPSISYQHMFVTRKYMEIITKI